ncbi:hypothetical protein H5T51_06415 [Candidatus Bathyarchaeota archaeon]|nr:hypothetical protein [Candidatus Bathyarchaeota archaeon]
MQKLIEARIDVDQKITKGEKLPEDMILYAVDSEHFVIAAKPLKNLEEKALLKINVKVVSEQNKYVIIIPQKIYDFYHLDENDYTVMTSEKNPTTLMIAI